MTFLVLSYLDIFKSKTNSYHKPLETVNLLVDPDLGLGSLVLQIGNRLFRLYKTVFVHNQ